MNFPFFIARRYLVAKKSHNVINIISGISVTGVMVGTMALVVILSVFNGFEKVVVSLFSVFDPEIRIVANEGKTFHPSEIPAADIRKLPGVVKYTEVLEENALLKYRDRQYLATLKGVDSTYQVHNPLDTLLTDGDLIIQLDSFDFAIPGYGVAYYLGLELNSPDNFVRVFVPRRNAGTTLSGPEMFHSEIISPSGIFAVQQDFDNRYMIVPLRFTQRLLEYNNRISAIEIRLTKNADTRIIQKRIEEFAGKSFKVQNRFQQQEVLYKTMKSEKWAVYFILLFILLVATFNMLGSLLMLIIDKKRDVEILRSMGANDRSIKTIFFFEGLLINAAGAISGMVFGFLVCLAQQQLGLIKLKNGGSSFIIDAYPIDMQIVDFIFVFVTVIIIGVITSWIPVRQLSRNVLGKRESI